MNLEEKERYARQIMLPEIGEAGQQKLKQAKVLIIGAGGLGSPVALYLAAAGVGHIALVDNDNVSVTNLQRQILYNSEVVGKAKVTHAREVLKSLNPNVSVRPVLERLTEINAAELIQAYDVIVDATDNFRARYLISQTCQQFSKPMVHGSIEEFKGMVSVFNYQGGPVYEDLFPEAPEDQSIDGAPKGVFGALPGIIGSMQAMEVLKIITRAGEILSGKLFVYNALECTSSILKLI
ncbi:adenylyltransferase/sulfurtransferase [Mangrovibacterium marinum]|uniref:Molybdopterin-synthase adenylyltransferase n=1 Tax=Mangrovibacterium marinum TaxID=1639118 RepID=A0A2T5BX47_9BACT|nr:HesA/MoeB/ThiF family protein [Mangrovibacterium marinum]PTN04338.1 adenylyltransferase/sulfurtransferase [Mangrovibacterium marinum]